MSPSRTEDETSARGRGPGDPPQVSIIIPARNEIGSIDAALDSVLAQRGPSLEVVVVDNGSTDGTAERLRDRAFDDPRIVVLHNSEPSIPGSLNLAVSRARGDWLVRVDAHSTIPPGYVGRAVRRLEEGRWAGVGGRKTAVARTRTGRAIATVLNSRLAVGGSTYHYGTTEQTTDHIPFGAYPAALVRELGGWDETIPANEDFEFDQRLRDRGELLFDPDLEIAWNARETVGQLFGQYRRYGRGKTLVAVRHPASLRMRHLAPPALVLWLAAATAVSTRRPVPAGLAVAPYALAVIGASWTIARGAPADANRTAIPAALVAMQVGWGLGFWQGALDLLRRRS